MLKEQEKENVRESIKAILKMALTVEGISYRKRSIKKMESWNAD